MNKFPPSRFKFLERVNVLFSVFILCSVCACQASSSLGVPNAVNLRDVPVSVEVVLVVGLAGGVHRGVPIGARARVRAGQRGVHFRHLQNRGKFRKMG
jgi:hypothetical protein